MYVKALSTQKLQQSNENTSKSSGKDLTSMGSLLGESSTTIKDVLMASRKYNLKLS